MSRFPSTEGMGKLFFPFVLINTEEQFLPRLVLIVAGCRVHRLDQRKEFIFWNIVEKARAGNCVSNCLVKDKRGICPLVWLHHHGQQKLPVTYSNIILLLTFQFLAIISYPPLFARRDEQDKASNFHHTFPRGCRQRQLNSGSSCPCTSSHHCNSSFH